MASAQGGSFFPAPTESKILSQLLCGVVIGTVYPNIPLSSASIHGHPRSSLGATLGVRMSMTAYGNPLNHVQCMANMRLQA